MCGFVDQDDQIIEKLTVEEMFTYACNFRPSKTSSKDVSSRIDELVKRFGLTNVVRNQMYKLSGGERKRVMIAIELITEPEIIFLDEPTSGLDTKTALVILKLLKELTNKGKYIILTIHQPSVEIFSMFDKFLLMSNSKTIYNGPVNSFEEFLNEKGLIKREGISFLIL